MNCQVFIFQFQGLVKNNFLFAGNGKHVVLTVIEYLAFQEEKKQKEDAKLSQKEKQFQALNESLFASWRTWDLKEFESCLVLNNFIVI